MDESAQISFSITTTTTHDLVLLGVRGDLDLMTVGQLSHAIDGALAEGAKCLVIDLTTTDFLAAVGLAALDNGRRGMETAGGRFAVVAPARSPARLITVLGLERTLNVHRSVDEALTSCGRGGRASHRLVTDAIGAQAFNRPA